MTEKTKIRLSRLKISNYKKIDSLEIDFLPPRMQGDPDILVLGSKNGGGKTSVLECCSLLIFAGIFKDKFAKTLKMNGSLLDITNLLVKAGQTKTIIECKVEQNNKKLTVSLEISNDKGFSSPHVKDDNGNESSFGLNKKDYPETLEYSLNSILAFSSEPLIIPPLLHFNSYRKVQESNPELGMMADDYPRNYDMRRRLGIRNIVNPVSAFKLEILRSLMGQASLFENTDKEQSESVLSQLNSLIKRYCGGQIAHLRPLPDNKIDIRIKPNNGKESFSFDGLSSGQKEMIATLFLIWKNTKEQPSIVLIDEPELHLNAEWHGDFVRQLYQLAPHNQYILATHSEEIFRSVEERHRSVLVPDEDG
ncbi:MAG: AAA family ATPase [Snowella sp.]|nr:AAA family ATPase [Snowella sp.]